MARRLRFARGGMLYHVLNRSAKKAPLFWTEQDYLAFEHLVREAKGRFAVLIFAYIVMPNHWHFLLSPCGDDDLSKFMHWLSTSHSRRWNISHQKSGEGAVYQGRFKAIPVQDDEHALCVWRYIERNALRAGLVARAEDWRWCSLAARLNGASALLDPASVSLPADWLEIVNRPQTPAELEAIRAAIESESPYGSQEWQKVVDNVTGREQRKCRSQRQAQECNGV